MDMLNEDCLRMMLKYLVLKDQISLLLAVPWMERIIHSFWHFKYRNVNYSYSDYQLNDLELKLFLNVMQQAMETFDLNWFSEKHLMVLFQHVFPNCHKLSFFPLLWTDDNLLCIQKSFPNLRTFIPIGRFNGKNLANLWSNLEHLTLTRSTALKLCYIHEILQKLKLKTLELDVLRDNQLTEIVNVNDFVNLHGLEVIHVNSFEYEKFLLKNLIPHLRKLREFKFANQTNWKIRMPIEDFLPKANELIEADVGYNIICYDFSNFPNLRKLKVDEKFYDHLTINMDNLRECVFYGCRNVSRQHFYELLSKSKKLTKLNVSHCTFEFPVLLNVPEIVADRETPLIFNFHNNFNRKLGKHSAAQVNQSSEKLKLMSYAESFTSSPTVILTFESKL